MRFVTSENILSYTLAFVVLWFGGNEILSPADWTVFAPSFLGSGSLVTAAVVIHGIVLSVCGILLVLNYGRRIAGAVLAIIFIEVIAGLVYVSGLSDIAVRDIGLLGASLALALWPKVSAPL